MPMAEEERAVAQALQALCQELNMDEETAAEALSNFTIIWDSFTLEMARDHLQITHMSRMTRPSTGKDLIKFFNKMKKWMDMSNLSQEFRERVESLERNFEVSTVIFKKRIPCSAKDLFKFCWTLFVYTKGNFRMIGDDLVNSYHLLLCCLDLIYANVLLCPNKKDLLNPSFKALPADLPTSICKPSEELCCIISTLCELHDGLTVEAKGIKEHYFKPYISKLFDRKILKGDCLLDISSFTENNKTLNKEYEEYVLTVGDFDERVFLGEDAEEEIGTPRKFVAEMLTSKVTTRIPVECTLQYHCDKKRSFAPSTPLTGRRYLKEKEAMNTPVTSATQSVNRLQSMVSGLKNAPSEQLVNIFKSCIRDPTVSIILRIKDIGEMFCLHYTQSTDEHSGSHIDFAVNRLKLAEILYYKILETIMVQETRRLHGKDMTALLEQDIFHCSLMACCLEIVLFAYSSPRMFPWIIEFLSLRPFYFYKVIEIVIRSEEGLSREMVKHLNSIEEQILESWAWGHDSALWDMLQASENRVPSCEEVIFPNNFEMDNEGNVQGHLPMMPMSPIVHPRLKEVRTDLGGNCRQDFQPLSPLSVHERYNSPSAGSAKRRLFRDDNLKEFHVEKINTTEMTKLKITPSTTVAIDNLSMSPSQMIFSTASTTVTGTMRHRVAIPVTGSDNDTTRITFIPLSMNLSDSLKSEADLQIPLTAQALISSPKQSYVSKAQEMYSVLGSKPKKTGSLALFFRKVYHLASVRLRDLCLKLDVSNELRRKIWTCFEYTLIHCTELMKDRHLDQLLLCAFYIMAKVTKEDRTFQDIMKCYRSQPQANSYVYRSVLLKTASEEVIKDNANIDLNVEMEDSASDGSTCCSSQRKSPENSSDQRKEERSDLITFYNAIYVAKMKFFALKYSFSTQDNMVEAPPLSPFPNIKQQPLSPRRVSQQHSIYVSPHKNGSCSTPRTALLYKFNGSPSKSLKDINNMIKQGDQRSKKRALTIDSDSESPEKRLCPEKDDVLLKRLQDVVSERANH